MCVFIVANNLPKKIPIIKLDGTKSSASLWLKEKINESGSSVFIWIFEEVYESSISVSVNNEVTSLLYMYKHELIVCI